MKKKFLLIFVILIGLGVLGYAGCRVLESYESRNMKDMKPVIYLYPEKKQEISVELLYNGKFTVSYPPYENSIHGWNVTAYPDGRIINHKDKKEYSYLFWEGESNDVEYDFTKGFVVEGKDTMNFLQDKLEKIGLLPKEYNEFIVYWFPQMQKNRYNLIHFAGNEYTDNAKLSISPKPDSILRVFMVYKPLEEKNEIEEQEVRPFKRDGFTVVEWGGCVID